MVYGVKGDQVTEVGQTTTSTKKQSGQSASGDTLKLSTRSGSRRPTKIKAQAALDDANLKQTAGSLTVPGNPKLVAGTTFWLTDCGKPLRQVPGGVGPPPHRSRRRLHHRAGGETRRAAGHLEASAAPRPRRSLARPSRCMAFRATTRWASSAPLKRARRNGETLQEFGASFKFGTVSAVDAKTCRVRVRLPDYDNLRTAWLPVLQTKTLRDKHYHLPDIGEHVVVLLDERGEDGVVLGAVYSSADTPPVASGDKHHMRFDDGAEMEYDRASHQLTVKGGIQKVVVEVGVDILLKAESKVTFDTPEAEFTGNLTVQKKLTYLGGMAGSGGDGASAVIEGGIRVSGDINATGSIMDGGGNSSHHNH